MKQPAACPRMALVAALVVLGACVAADDVADDGDNPPLEPIAEAPVSDDTVFFDTVVELHEDGTFVVGAPRPVTAGEQRAQNELRLAIENGEAQAPGPGIAQDFSCLYDSFWMYSRSDFTGSRICFRGLGPAFLSEYTRYVLVNGLPLPIGDWRIMSGSYWPGSDAGLMRNQYGIYDPSTLWELSWSAWGYRHVFSEPSRPYFISLY